MNTRQPRNRLYDGRFYARTIDRMLARMRTIVAGHVEPCRRLLDVGCGTGALALLLAERADEVLGVELSPKMVDFANRQRTERGLTHLSFVLGDVTRVCADLPTEHFDLATMVLTLHEMPSDARTPVLAEVGRLARQVLCVDFCAPMPFNRAGIRNRAMEIAAGVEHYRAFRDFTRRGGVAGLAAAAGLEYRHLRTIDARTVELCLLARPA